jgi:hypothetical protein
VPFPRRQVQVVIEDSLDMTKPLNAGFSALLVQIHDATQSSERVSVAELRDRLAGQAWPLLLVLFALPFITPIPTMGLSAPFGIGIAGIGLGIALSRPPPIPGFVLRIQIRSDLLRRLTTGGAGLAQRLDRHMRPRWTFLVDGLLVRVIHGSTIAICALLLALPLPIPLSNALPSWSLIALGIGLLQRDGAAVVAGHALALITYVFFAVLTWLGTAGVAAIWERL